MRTNSKWVKFITDNGTVDITDKFARLQFLDFVEDGVQIATDTQEIKGTDGVLVSASTFSPFDLTLRFAYVGQDIKDYHLFKSEFRGTIFKREPFFVRHSDFPGRKYAVIPKEVSYEDKYGRNGEISVTFSCYKGYSESVRDTSDIKLLQENTQYSDMMGMDEQLQYTHTTKEFTVYNGSTDTIDPGKRHRLAIQMNIEAPNGFKIRNKTTGDIFEYKKSIKKSQTFLLNSVYPYVNKKRVGINTNYSYITLVPGNNNIVIEGDGITTINIQWIFNFIYR